MYKIKNKIYADAGCILKYNNKLGFNFRDVEIEDVSEIKINLDDMFIDNGMLVYSNGLLREFLSYTTYGEGKSKFINKQFTNDDQIAIILNKEDSEEDLLLYNKMQEGRAGSGIIAKKIINLN